MTKTHVSPEVINATVVAVRFFFKKTLERDDLVRRLTLVTEPRSGKIDRRWLGWRAFRRESAPPDLSPVLLQRSSAFPLY
jgi:hypothetical protein